LPRPHKLLDILKAKYSGQHYDEAELNSILAPAVTDCVCKQVQCGIDVVTDGECSKPGFFTYIRERFDGLQAPTNHELWTERRDVQIEYRWGGGCRQDFNLECAPRGGQDYAAVLTERPTCNCYWGLSFPH
jgi:hypothetical protein